MALDELKLIANEQRWQDALSMIKEKPELRELNPEYVSILSWRSNAKLGYEKDAEKELDIAIKISPTNAMLQRAKGDFHKVREEWKFALECYKTAVVLREDIPAYWICYALAQEKLGLISEAQHSLETTVSLDPNRRQWWLKLAYICRLNKNLEGALSAYDKALEMKNDVQITAMRDETLRQMESGSMVASAEYYDKVYSASEKYQTHGSDSVYKSAWEYILSILNEREVTSILDLGCGPGQFAEFLVEANMDVSYVGLDFSSVAIQQAKNRCPQFSFYRETLPLKSYSQFGNPDVLICTEVLEHVENDLELLASYPKGKYLIITVPNFDSFGHVRYFITKDEVLERYSHIFEEPVIGQVNLSEKSILWVIKGIIS